MYRPLTDVEKTTMDALKTNNNQSTSVRVTHAEARTQSACAIEAVYTMRVTDL